MVRKNAYVFSEDTIQGLRELGEVLLVIRTRLLEERCIIDHNDKYKQSENREREGNIEGRVKREVP